MRAVTDGREFIVQPAFDETDRGISTAAVPEGLHDVVRQLSRRARTPSDGPTCASPALADDHADPQGPAAVPLEAETLSPDVMAGLTNEEIRALPVLLGKRQRRLDDFFAVEGEASDDLEIRGDVSRSSGSAAR